MNEETIRVLHQSEPNDTRFQFEIIKGLAESIRQMAAQMGDMQKTQVSVLERLATLEANKFADAIKDLIEDVDALKADRQRRDGAIGMLGTLKSWAPFLAMLFSAAVALVVYGRIAGVIPAAPVATARIEAAIHPEERKIEGIVGGKP